MDKLVGGSSWSEEMGGIFGVEVVAERGEGRDGGGRYVKDREVGSEHLCERDASSKLRNSSSPSLGPQGYYL